MPEAVIVSTARTPIGKAFRGAFNMTHGATLGGHMTQAAVERAKIDPARVEDVIMGCANAAPANRDNTVASAILDIFTSLSPARPRGSRDLALWRRARPPGPPLSRG